MRTLQSLCRGIGVIAICALVNCARGPLKDSENAMRLSASPPAHLHDDLDFEGLVVALETNVTHLRESAHPDTFLSFGPRKVSLREYLQALELLLNEAKQDPSGERFRKLLRQEFEPYEVYGDEDWGQVFITSYFEPVIEGARHPTGRFRQPLYGVPKDMVLVDMSSFASMRSNVSPGRGVLRGRLVAPTGGEMGRIVAYPSRAEIDSSGLQGQAQVLAYVDPVDAFFLEIQGSGVVHFSDGRELKLGYAAQNGHAYVPVGKFLLDRIPKERMSLQMIESHLRSLPTEEARRLMWQNPSYVFFQRLPNAGRTFLGTEVVAGRTIATDRSLFPKGTLAFLEFEKPIFRSSEDTEPASWQKTSRFVLDQDTGGAIRGPHRVDLFWGRGPLAKQAAGVMKGRGRLIYFVPRTSETPLRLGSVQGRP